MSPLLSKNISGSYPSSLYLFHKFCTCHISSACVPDSLFIPTYGVSDKRVTYQSSFLGYMGSFQEVPKIWWVRSTPNISKSKIWNNVIFHQNGVFLFPIHNLTNYVFLIQQQPKLWITSFSVFQKKHFLRQYRNRLAYSLLYKRSNKINSKIQRSVNVTADVQTTYHFKNAQTKSIYNCSSNFD